MKNTLNLIGRILFAVPLAMFGVGHLTQASMMTGMIPSALSSVATPLVYLTGVGLIAAAISVLINKWTLWSGLLLFLFLALTALTVQLPGMIHAADNTWKMVFMGSLQKDLMLAGASLILAGMGSKK